MPFFMSFFQSSVRRQPWDPFKVLFSYSLKERILSQTNYLSKRLQEGVVTAADAMMRVETNDASSQVFWEQLEEKWGSLEIDKPILPRGSIYRDPEVHFRAFYMKAHDNIAEWIVSIFKQQDFLIYKNIHGVFLKSVSGETYTSELQIYQADLNQEDLQFEIALFESSLSSCQNIDILFQSLTCLLLLGSWHLSISTSTKIL